MPQRVIGAGDVKLAVVDDGEGIPVILAHGLTASRRYVVMGSRSLARSGHRVIAYDARGHGASSPAPEAGAYGYEHLCRDLVAVLDALGLDRAVMAGASMGAHTILRLALDAPERVAGLVVITPSYEPVEHADERRLLRWDALADALRDSGVEGFVAAYGLEDVPEGWRATIGTVLRQRLAAHQHPAAVADALRAVPRSRPFADLNALEAIACPAVVVASRDGSD
ncbi:MAG: alpha/beta hydrolase, partial [Solirubrobacterales bacterium]|nr:alpha/beta hydrolase [Solirubrobacterales bacterium]